MPITSSVPILSPLKVSGGTFYTFSSTVNDFSYLFTDSNVRIAPSKFVAMKLPKWQNTTGQKLFLDPADVGQPTITDPNTVLPKIIQDYTENLIQYSESERTDQTLGNYAESAWWKTLRMLGGMELEDTLDTIIENGVTKKLYKEATQSNDYDQIIKFVGDVNMLNHVKSSGNEYIEMFVNIPTDQGLMEGIKFKKDDLTFPSGLIPISGGTEWASGLENHHLANTDNAKAIYDNVATRQYQVGDDLESANVFFDDILGDETRHKKGNFDFNAIALYYDVYDRNDETKVRTSLYGILMVEDFNSISSGVGELPLLKKYQPSVTTNGNGYSFRMNLKFSNSTNHLTSEVSINDYSTVSMELYMEALQRLTKMTDKVEDILKITEKVKSENDRILTTLMQYDKILESVTQIDENKKAIELINTGSTVGASNGVRISNEELFKAFENVTNAAQNGELTVTNIISKKAYLAKMVDELNNIVEFEDGTRYQWDKVLQIWNLIN